MNDAGSRHWRSTRAWPTSGLGSSGLASRQASKPFDAASAAAKASGWCLASAAATQAVSESIAARCSGAASADWAAAGRDRAHDGRREHGRADDGHAGLHGSSVSFRMYSCDDDLARAIAPAVPRTEFVDLQGLTICHVRFDLQPRGFEAACRLRSIARGAPLSWADPHAPMRASRPIRSSRAMLVVMLGIGVSRLFGLVREQVVAFYFGRSAAYSAFIAAYKVPNLVRVLLGEETSRLRSSRSWPSGWRSEDPGEAERLARGVLGLLLATVGVVPWPACSPRPRSRGSSRRDSMSRCASSSSVSS